MAAPRPCRLFLGNLPKAKTEDDIRDEVGRATRGLVRVIAYKNPEDPRLHRGFCFVDYESTAAAADALHRLRRDPVFGGRAVADWADPEPEPAADVMARVRILFVRLYGGALDEAALAAAFGRHGAVERVKRLKHYAFVHFASRDDARAAMEALDGAVDADTGVRMEVSWAKQPADKAQRERALRDRERRMMWSVAATGRGGSAPAAEPGPGAGRAYTGDNYDHYVYDFGAAPAVVPADAAGHVYDHFEYDFGAGAAAGPADRCARPRQRGRCDEPAHRRQWDHGDRADVDGHGGGADVDDKIRMFFLKVSIGEILSSAKAGKQ